MYEREKSRSAKKSAKNLGARKKSAKNQGARERESANAKARNLRPKKERESASAKSSAKERESASAKRKKKRVPSSAYITTVVVAITSCTGFTPAGYRHICYYCSGYYY